MATDLPTLAAVLAQVPDPRCARGQRHPWTALLLLIVAALLSGHNSQQAMARFADGLCWPSLRRLGFTRPGGPGLATLHRLLHQVPVTDLETVLGQWLGQMRRAWSTGPCHWLDGIALDGKTLRTARALGAHDVHLLSACCQRHSLVLRQQAVPDGTNEVGALPPFLDQLDLRGETVTFDAEFTQWLVAQQVVAQGGAYLMAVKANQPTLLRACVAATTQPAPLPTRRLGHAQTTQLAHGRLEERHLWVVEARPDRIPWPHARQVLRLQRHVTDKQTGQVREETVYAVTSLGPEQASPRQLLRLWQRHWWVENKIHWVRDVDFGEDASTTHTGTAPQTLAAFRNLAISLLHRWKRSDITAARQYFASHPSALLRRLQLP